MYNDSDFTAGNGNFRAKEKKKTTHQNHYVTENEAGTKEMKIKNGRFHFRYHLSFKLETGAQRYTVPSATKFKKKLIFFSIHFKLHYWITFLLRLNHFY